VTKEEWENIPEPIEVRKSKEKKKHYMPTPDNIIAGIRNIGETDTSIEA